MQYANVNMQLDLATGVLWGRGCRLRIGLGLGVRVRLLLRLVIIYVVSTDSQRFHGWERNGTTGSNYLNGIDYDVSTVGKARA